MIAIHVIIYCVFTAPMQIQRADRKVEEIYKNQVGLNEADLLFGPNGREKILFLEYTKDYLHSLLNNTVSCLICAFIIYLHYFMLKYRLYREIAYKLFFCLHRGEGTRTRSIEKMKQEYHSLKRNFVW